mmetsp:Transcript_35957/g.90204  ORF Transcript_35957/g.90204 Transcript_35957/m.90204 type:complete len:220 (+) Transcript_35957:284-943(+)
MVLKRSVWLIQPLSSRLSSASRASMNADASPSSGYLRVSFRFASTSLAEEALEALDEDISLSVLAEVEISLTRLLRKLFRRSITSRSEWFCPVTLRGRRITRSSSSRSSFLYSPVCDVDPEARPDGGTTRRSRSLETRECCCLAARFSSFLRRLRSDFSARLRSRSLAASSSRSRCIRIAFCASSLCSLLPSACSPSPVTVASACLLRSMSAILLRNES